MCNEAARRIALGQLREDFSELRIPLRFPEGLPNFEPTDSIRITDPAPILRAATDAPGEVEMLTRRWSWPGPRGRPIYNFRSDGREFRNAATGGRCLIPLDGFYEFTDPPAGAEEAGRKRAPKAKWRFRMAGATWFGVAGLWRRYRAGDGEADAWTMLTCPPGADIVPYHDRQIVLLARADYAGWLDGSIPAAAVCRPMPAGSLTVERVR